MTGTDIVERIMTQHWDLAACPCWICVEGNKAGLRPRSKYLGWRAEGWTLVEIPLLSGQTVPRIHPPAMSAGNLHAIANRIEHHGSTDSDIRCLRKWADYIEELRAYDAYRAALSNSQVRPEQANAQQDGAADNPGEGEL